MYDPHQKYKYRVRVTNFSFSVWLCGSVHFIGSGTFIGTVHQCKLKCTSVYSVLLQAADSTEEMDAVVFAKGTCETLL